MTEIASHPSPIPPSAVRVDSTEPRLYSRRRFLSVIGSGVAAGLVAPAIIEGVEPGVPKRRVCLVATEVWKYSHAEHFLDRLLEGYGWQGEHHYPPLELVSMYVDHFPENDLSRERAWRHGIKIYPTIREALTLGGSELAVDGVLIVGEHGKYPRNAKGQTLYPRFKFFREVTQVFEDSHRAVPVFNDKHLSTDWTECVAMVEASRRLNFPFIAGSSLPVTWRIPSLELELETPLEESVCAGYGGVDSYDFHGLETAQCMSERRRGGESGVRSIEALRGERVWERVRDRDRTRELLFAALTRSDTCTAPPGYTVAPPQLDWLRRASPDVVAYFIEHLDGLQTTMFLLNGLLQDFTYAGAVRGSGQVVSCQMYLPMPPARATLADFFNPLMNNVEQTFTRGVAPYPIERTLLTSGLTLFAVESLYRGQVRLLTPELKVSYRAHRESSFWRA